MTPDDQVATLIRLAKEATNGWACYAKRKIEHDDIARLHREIDAASKPVAAQPFTRAQVEEQAADYLEHKEFAPVVVAMLRRYAEDLP